MTTIIIPDWFVILFGIVMTIHTILEWRKGSLTKKKLKLEQEIFEHEKKINQYSKVLADASRIVNSPKHSSR
jgi:hypothetical protein